MDESFNLECLHTHNELRGLHKSPPLRLSIQLAEDSQIASDNIARKIKQIKKKPPYMFGENKSFSNYKQSGEEITLKWYREIFDYKFGQERQNLAAICHFAQIVWKETIEVGFGRSKSDDGQWIVIARYARPGNIVGKFLSNVQHRIIGWENYSIIIKLKSLDFKDFPSTMSNKQTGSFFNNEINTNSRNTELLNNKNIVDIRNRSENFDYKDELNINNNKNNLNPYNYQSKEKDELKHKNTNDFENEEIKTMDKIKSIDNHYFRSNDDKVLDYLEQNENKRLPKPITKKRDFVDKRNYPVLKIISSEPSSVYSNYGTEQNKTDDINRSSNTKDLTKSNLLDKVRNESESSIEISLEDRNKLNSRYNKNENIFNTQNSLLSAEKSHSPINDSLIIKSNKFPERSSFQNIKFNSVNDENNMRKEDYSIASNNQLKKFPGDIKSKNLTKNDLEVSKENQNTSSNNSPEEIIQPKKTYSDGTNLNFSTIDFVQKDDTDESIIEFRNEILRAHNEYRALNKVKPLNFNLELTNLAQKWADHISATNQLGYSKWIYSGVEIGENIVIQLKGSLLDFIQKMVNNWYNEKENFLYDVEPKNIDNIGHFSQVVWATTKEIGIGISTLSNFSVIVCFYFPPGNTKGEFTKNIRPINKI